MEIPQQPTPEELRADGYNPENWTVNTDEDLRRFNAALEAARSSGKSVTITGDYTLRTIWTKEA